MKGGPVLVCNLIVGDKIRMDKQWWIIKKIEDDYHYAYSPNTDGTTDHIIYALEDDDVVWKL